MTRKSFRTLIIMCWVVLLVCVVIKLFGGNWFEFATDNQHFIQFCNYVDNTQWLKMIIASVFSLISSYPVYLLIYNKKWFNKKENFCIIPIIVIRSYLSWYLPILVYIIDFLMLILFPIIITRKWKRVLIVNVGVFILQLLTIVIRNLALDVSFNINSTLISMLYQIDYLVMLIICYLYNIKYFIKEGK